MIQTGKVNAENVIVSIKDGKLEWLAGHLPCKLLTDGKPNTFKLSNPIEIPIAEIKGYINDNATGTTGDITSGGHMGNHKYYDVKLLAKCNRLQKELSEEKRVAVKYIPLTIGKLVEIVKERELADLTA